jgi:uncharacterized membrane protein YeaQ/YmgE (transglycosylase-associated protein family)
MNPLEQTTWLNEEWLQKFRRFDYRQSGPPIGRTRPVASSNLSGIRSPLSEIYCRFLARCPDRLSVDSNFEGGNIIMLHLIWYIIVGLIAGWAAKSLMHMHMSILWTIGLGIVGSVVGGLVTHIFSRPKEGAQFHPAGLIVSFLGALLVLWLWHHFKLHIPTG